jgi:molybdopterin converting factor subunit 1
VVPVPHPDPSEPAVASAPAKPDGGGAPLQIGVRLFAGLREAAGWGERDLEIPAGATPRTLWRHLGLASPPASEAGELPKERRVAINQAFATPDTPLADGDELAFLPPISGG